MEELLEVMKVLRREKHFLFICAQRNFKKSSSLQFCFHSGYMHREILIDDFLFEEDIYCPVPQFLLSGHDLICFFTNLGDIYVCNPHAHGVQALPHGSGHLQCLGFSYQSSTEEYIVVRLFEFQEKGLSGFSTGIEVMKFGENPMFVGFDDSSWKKAKKSFRFSFDGGNRAFDEGPVVERTMHWYVYNVPNCILAYDIDDENLCTIDVPSDLHQGYVSFSVLMNLNGKLCVTGIDKTENTPILKIWGLQEREKSLWVSEYTIRLDDLEYGFLKERNFNFEKLYPSHTSDGELVFGAYGKFYFYNIEKRSFRKVNGPDGCFKIGFIKKSG